MPRYAKGSLEEALYDDLKIMVEFEEEQVGMSGQVGPPILDRLRAIKSIIRMNDLGWVRDDHALQTIQTIARGD